MTRFARIRLGMLGLAAGASLAAFADLHGQPPAPAATLPKELSSYRDVVKQVLPAVVSIESRATARKLPNAAALQSPPNLPDEFRRYFENQPQPQAPADGMLGSGSGVIVDAAGVILTNFHVVDGADSVEVTLHDGRKFLATDIRRDPKTDLAVLRIAPGKPLPFLEFADSDAYEVGDRILAVGAPFGLSGSVTHGIISAKGRSAMHINQYEDFLQIDAAINPGNSGGPLVGLDGKIVGINSAIKSRSGGFQGIGLAISSNMAREISKQLLATGTVKRGYLGVGIRDLDAKVAERLGASNGGVLVTKVYDGTPAAKAGLKSGDVILSVGGALVKESAALPRTVAKMPLGQPAEIVILRDGKTLTQAVTIKEQPEDYGNERKATNTATPAPKSQGTTLPGGLTVVELNAENAAQYGYSKRAKGLAISAVEPGSAGATVGLTRSLMIQKIDQTAIATVADAEKALAAASKEKGALLQVARPGGEVDYVVLPVN